jgi:hypothetical protein
MKTQSFSIFNIQYTILLLFFLVSCENMKIELDVTSISFPPKLSVTAILDGGDNSLLISFSEGRALSDYAEPLPNDRVIIREGEIRLFEDNQLIWSKPGPFDMSVSGESWAYQTQNGYYHVEQGIATRAGSTYRLEVQVEGYPVAVSTSVMPAPPDVSASIDANVTVEKWKFYETSSYVYWDMEGIGGQYNPLSVHFVETSPDVRKYFALELYVKTDRYLQDVYLDTSHDRHWIGVSDLTKLQDNPDVEASDLLLDTYPKDLYVFAVLLQSNLTFSKGNNIFNYFAPDVLYWLSDCWCSSHHPKVTLQNTLTLRVKQLTAASFRFYRSLRLQDSELGFFTEPVNVVGNIENGYGSFAVLNSVSIPLMEYESCKCMSME